MQRSVHLEEESSPRCLGADQDCSGQHRHWASASKRIIQQIQSLCMDSKSVSRTKTASFAKLFQKSSPGPPPTTHPSISVARKHLELARGALENPDLICFEAVVVPPTRTRSLSQDKSTEIVHRHICAQCAECYPEGGKTVSHVGLVKPNDEDASVNSSPNIATLELHKPVTTSIASRQPNIRATNDTVTEEGASMSQNCNSHEQSKSRSYMKSFESDTASATSCWSGRSTEYPNTPLSTLSWITELDEHTQKQISMCEQESLGVTDSLKQYSPLGPLDAYCVDTTSQALLLHPVDRDPEEAEHCHRQLPANKLYVEGARSSEQSSLQKVLKAEEEATGFALAIPPLRSQSFDENTQNISAQNFHDPLAPAAASTHYQTVRETIYFTLSSSALSALLTNSSSDEKEQSESFSDLIPQPLQIEKIESRFCDKKSGSQQQAIRQEPVTGREICCSGSTDRFVQSGLLVHDCREKISLQAQKQDKLSTPSDKQHLRLPRLVSPNPEPRFIAPRSKSQRRKDRKEGKKSATASSIIDMYAISSDDEGSSPEISASRPQSDHISIWPGGKALHTLSKSDIRPTHRDACKASPSASSATRSTSAASRKALNRNFVILPPLKELDVPTHPLCSATPHEYSHHQDLCPSSSLPATIQQDDSISYDYASDFIRGADESACWHNMFLRDIRCKVDDQGKIWL